MYCSYKAFFRQTQTTVLLKYRCKLSLLLFRYILVGDCVSVCEDNIKTCFGQTFCEFVVLIEVALE